MDAATHLFTVFESVLVAAKKCRYSNCLRATVMDLPYKCNGVSLFYFHDIELNTEIILH